jgi:hypothetical protein
MSWDNNNLACILVFPPWQRKGLGSLLMGVSYEISRREGLLGGPEKPISDLGKKGYKRFWAGEIARWLLSLNVRGRDTSAPSAGGETVVDIEGCSQATWIAPEDCLLVLREMGVAEDAGRGPPPWAQQQQQLAINGAEDVHHNNNSGADNSNSSNNNNSHNNNITNGLTAAGALAAGLSTTTATETAASAAAAENKVQRVRISQAAVRAWVAAQGISLERACDPDGFVEGYAVKGSAEASEEPV